MRLPMIVRQASYNQSEGLLGETSGFLEKKFCLKTGVPTLVSRIQACPTDF